MRDAAGVEARLSEWTAELHAERRDDPRYSESVVEPEFLLVCVRVPSFSTSPGPRRVR